MSERTLRRLLAALVALVLIYGGFVLLGRRTPPASAGTDGALASALDRLRDDSLIGVRVASPAGEVIELQQRENGWSVNSFRADSQAVSRLKRALDDATVAGLAARSDANHARLGVTHDGAWQVELRGARATETILIGNTGAQYSSAYMRLPGDSQVWQVNGELRDALTLRLDDWRDRTIARIDTAAVHSILIVRDGQTAHVQRAGQGWHANLNGGNAAVDSLRLRDLLAELANFAATGFAPDSIQPATAERRIVALGAAGDTLVAIEFAAHETVWHARTRGNPDRFEVSSYRLDRITPKPEELIQAAPSS